MHAFPETPRTSVIAEGTAITALRIFVRQTEVRGVTFGNPAPIVGDVAGWAFTLFGETLITLPRDGCVATPCGAPVRIHIDDLGTKFIARLYPCAADIAGQTVFF